MKLMRTQTCFNLHHYSQIDLTNFVIILIDQEDLSAL